MLALGGTEWSLSCPCHFTHGERAPSATHWKEGWVGSRAGLELVAKRDVPFPCHELNPSCSSHSIVTVLIELYCPPFKF